MIGWTQKRKRCKEHGLVLRKRPGSYSDKAEYCPACGKKLMLVSVPYLFQVYFHPAIMVVPGILAFFLGLFMFLDVRGCIQEDRRQEALAAQRLEEQISAHMESMPHEWRTLFAGMKNSQSSDRFRVLKDYLEQKQDVKLPHLSPEQIEMMLSLISWDRDDDAFALMTKHMEAPE